MKLDTIRNLSGLLTSEQFSFTGDQLLRIVEIIQELSEEEKLAIRREALPPVTLGSDDESYIAALAEPK